MDITTTNTTHTIMDSVSNFLTTTQDVIYDNFHAPNDGAMYIMGISIRKWSLWISAPSVLLACIISLVHMVQHCRKNKDPDIRRHLLRLLFMVPMYGINALMALFFPLAVEIFTLMREVYEGITIYSLAQFLFTYLGGEMRLNYLLSLQQQEDDEYHIYRLAQNLDNANNEIILSNKNFVNLHEEQDDSETIVQRTIEMDKSNVGYAQNYYTTHKNYYTPWYRKIPFFNKSNVSYYETNTEKFLRSPNSSGNNNSSLSPLGNGNSSTIPFSSSNNNNANNRSPLLADHNIPQYNTTSPSDNNNNNDENGDTFVPTSFKFQARKTVQPIAATEEDKANYRLSRLKRAANKMRNGGDNNGDNMSIASSYAGSAISMDSYNNNNNLSTSLKNDNSAISYTTTNDLVLDVGASTNQHPPITTNTLGMPIQPNYSLTNNQQQQQKIKKTVTIFDPKEHKAKPLPQQRLANNTSDPSVSVLHVDEMHPNHLVDDYTKKLDVLQVTDDVQTVGLVSSMSLLQSQSMLQTSSSTLYHSSALYTSNLGGNSFIVNNNNNVSGNSNNNSSNHGNILQPLPEHIANQEALMNSTSMMMNGDTGNAQPLQRVITLKYQPQQHNEERLYPHLFPLNWFFKPVDGPRFLFLSKFTILQYVPIQIICAVIALIGHINHVYTPGDWKLNNMYPYLAVVLNFSQFAAMYGLFFFLYHFQANLQPCNAMKKAMTVKAVVFFTFWLSCIISLYYHFYPWCTYDPKEAAHDGVRICLDGEWDSKDQAAALNNFLICLQMLIFAIVHVYVFPWREFGRRITYIPQRPLLRSVIEFFSPVDIIEDVQTNMTLSNFKEALIPTSAPAPMQSASVGGQSFDSQYSLSTTQQPQSAFPGGARSPEPV